MPKILQTLPAGWNAFDSGVAVAGTNIALTVILMLLILVGAKLFNDAIKHNGSELPSRLPAPGFLSAIGSALGASFALFTRVIETGLPGSTRFDWFVSPLELLVLTAVIYGFLDPSFGFDQASLVLVVSLVIGQGALTVLLEGGKVAVLRRVGRVDARVTLFPACIAIAVVSVMVSRIGGLQPGLVVGFIASATQVGGTRLSAGENGRVNAFAAAGALIVGVAAWLLAYPLGDLLGDDGGIAAALLESIPLTMFVVCISGLVFSLIPLQFLDGAEIWRWSPVAWAALFIPAAFLFTQVLFNQTESYAGLLSDTRSISGLLLIAGYVVVTFGTWMILRSPASRPDIESGAVAAD